MLMWPNSCEHGYVSRIYAQVAGKPAVHMFKWTNSLLSKHYVEKQLSKNMCLLTDVFSDTCYHIMCLPTKNAV